MFKVFRRDCIEGIDFHSNYFNFDYELLLKIVRKGYEPMRNTGKLSIKVAR